MIKRNSKIPIIDITTVILFHCSPNGYQQSRFKSIIYFYT